MKYRLTKIIKLGILSIIFLAMFQLNAQGACECPSNKQNWERNEDKAIYENCAKSFMSCIDNLRKEFDKMKMESLINETKAETDTIGIDSQMNTNSLRKKTNKNSNSQTNETNMSKDEIYDILSISYNKLIEFCKTDNVKYYDEIEKYEDLLKSLQRSKRK